MEQAVGMISNIRFSLAYSFTILRNFSEELKPSDYVENIRSEMYWNNEKGTFTNFFIGKPSGMVVSRENTESKNDQFMQTIANSTYNTKSNL